MRLLYLGELIPDSYITWCLRQAEKFERIDHFTKPTLELTHISMNPLPDAIAIRCDWDDKELEWSKRYALEIPKVFITCEDCLRKLDDYMKQGKVFDMDKAIQEKDILLQSLVDLLVGAIS